MFKGSYDLIKAIIEKVPLHADLKMLLIAIANHWSKDNPNPFPEYDTLVVEAGISKRALPRKLKALKDAGWLEWEHGKGRSNIYTLAVEKIEALSAAVALPEMARPDLALPNGEVAPKLGTQVAPKLGTLTNKERTIYNKQRVEPNKQAAGMDESIASVPSALITEPMPANREEDMRIEGCPFEVEFEEVYTGPIPANPVSLKTLLSPSPAARLLATPPPPPPPVAPPPHPKRYKVIEKYKSPGIYLIRDSKKMAAYDDYPFVGGEFVDRTVAEANAEELEKAA